METAPHVVGGAQYLTFRVAEEEYAVDVLRVREVVPFSAITHVPKAPPWIRGVALLRGQAVPVVDLAAKLGLPPTTPTMATCIVIVDAELRSEPVVMGMTTDAVTQVVDLGHEDMLPPPVLGTRIRVEYLRGLARTGPRLALVLDIDRVLSADEVLCMADVASEVQQANPPDKPAAAEPVSGTTKGNERLPTRRRRPARA